MNMEIFPGTLEYKNGYYSFYKISVLLSADTIRIKLKILTKMKRENRQII